MTKIEFLQQLYNHLLPLSNTERDEIISDFEEHFSVGIEIGKTEEQICEELGNPYNCALQYLRQTPKMDNTVNQNYAQEKPKQNPYYPKAEQPVYNGDFDTKNNNMLWAAMFFFLVFVAIGVYPTSGGFMIGSIALLAFSAFSATLLASWAMFGTLISAAVMLFCLGLLGILVMTLLLKMAWKRSGL